jgi:hypothetical protein
MVAEYPPQISPQEDPLNSESSYQKKGMLESLYPNIEPLPPTEIEASTQEKLLSWGISEKSLQRLQELTASFRYDLIPQKLERLKKLGIYLGDDRVLMPYFYAGGGRFDGECSDLANEWVDQMEYSGLLHDMQQEIDAFWEEHGFSFKLVTTLSRGLSQFHFNQPGMMHVWAGLAMIDGEGEVADRVLVDPAYQKIMPNHMYREPGKADIDIKATFRSETEAVASIGLLRDSGENFTFLPGSDIILGISSLESSSEPQFAYGLLFVRVESTGEVTPVLKRIHPNGRDHDFIFIHPTEGPVMTHNFPNPELGEVNIDPELEVLAAFKKELEFREYREIEDKEDEEQNQDLYFQEEPKKDEEEPEKDEEQMPPEAPYPPTARESRATAFDSNLNKLPTQDEWL